MVRHQGDWQGRACGRLGARCGVGIVIKVYPFTSDREAVNHAECPRIRVAPRRFGRRLGVLLPLLMLARLAAPTATIGVCVAIRYIQFLCYAKHLDWQLCRP